MRLVVYVAVRTVEVSLATRISIFLVYAQIDFSYFLIIFHIKRVYLPTVLQCLNFLALSVVVKLM